MLTKVPDASSKELSCWHSRLVALYDQVLTTLKLSSAEKTCIETDYIGRIGEKAFLKMTNFGEPDLWITHTSTFKASRLAFQQFQKVYTSIVFFQVIYRLESLFFTTTRSYDGHSWSNKSKRFVFRPIG